MNKEEKECFMCGRSEEASHFMISVNGFEMCDHCLAVLNIWSNKAYLDMAYDDQNEYEKEPNQESDEAEGKRRPRSKREINRQLAERKEKEKKNQESLLECMKPKAIYEHFEKNIIGQEEAKKSLSIAIYNHYKRVYGEMASSIKKSNVLMKGPSGSGKTYLAQEAAKILGVPFVIVDATCYTEAGYVGENVENILIKLLRAADGDVEKAEKGIVFIDEIDKIARKSSARSQSRDVSGEGVQHALLKIIEGTKVSIPVGGRNRAVDMNTDNILFICGGAFEGMDHQKEESIQKKQGIGFVAGSMPSKENVPKTDEFDLEEGVTQDDFIQYGMIPELMGRLPVLVTLEELTESQLVQIMTDTDESILCEYKKLFELDDVELEFKEEALIEIARIAIRKHIGARGLRSILEKVMKEAMFNIPSMEGVGKCVITKETVYNKQFEMVEVA